MVHCQSRKNILCTKKPRAAVEIDNQVFKNVKIVNDIYKRNGGNLDFSDYKSLIRNKLSIYDKNNSIFFVFSFGCKSPENEMKNITKKFLEYAKENDMASLKALVNNGNVAWKDSMLFINDMKKIHDLIINNSVPQNLKLEKYNANWMTAFVTCNLGQLPDEIVQYNLELNFVEKEKKVVLMGYILEREIK